MGWVYPQIAGFLWRESDLPDIVMRMVLRGWGVRVGALGAVVAVLAGCSGDAEPVVTPTPSQTPTETVVESPSPTPSPTPTELTEQEILEAIPEAARTEDFWGAQEFTRFFLSEFPILFQEPYDGRLFRALSDQGCVFCQSALENQGAAEEAAAFTGGGSFQFPDPLATGGLREDGTWLVEQAFSVDDTEYFDEEGKLYRTTPGGTGTVGVHLDRVDDRWVVLGVTFEYDDDA